MKGASFAFREATADAPSMAQLWLEATAEVAAHEPIYTPVVGLANLAERLSDELRKEVKRAFVVYAGDMLAAYVTFRLEHDLPLFTPRRYLYVIDLDVSAAFRRRGLSRLLMSRVEVYTKSQGVNRIELSVAFADPGAKEVWARHGFKPHLLVMYKEVK